MSDDLTVTYKDASITLNKDLLDRQDCWENLALLKKWHEKRLKTEYRMSICKNEKDMDFLREKWTTIQFMLQEAWGFEQDAKRHRFWDIPTCKCPKMDNNDAYPSSFYTVSGECPIHGNKTIKEI